MEVHLNGQVQIDIGHTLKLVCTVSIATMGLFLQLALFTHLSSVRWLENAPISLYGYQSLFA